MINQTDITAWLIALAALGGAFGALLKLRSEGIFVKPSVIKELQDGNADLNDRLDKEIKSRRTLETASSDIKIENEKLSNRLDSEIKARRKLQAISQDARDRISSLEENDEMNQKNLVELRTTLENWQKGIQVLIAQIERHDSKPDWKPKG